MKPKPLTEVPNTLSEIDSLRMVLGNEVLFAETFLRVVDMAGKLVPFRLSTMPMQEHFVREVWTPRVPRIIELKARRVGGTTLFQALGLSLACTTPNRTIALLAQDDPESIKFMRIWRKLYEDMVPEVKLSDGTIVNVRPDLEHDSDHHLSFRDTGSALLVGSAGSLKFGRGQGLYMVIGTEAARWDVQRPPGTAEEAWAMAEGALVPGGIGILESTAYGAGGFFFETYQGAKSGTNGWKALFYDWRWHPLYFIPEGSPEALDTDRGSITLVDEEVELGLTDSQARWRRAKIARMAGRDPRAKLALFLQEYPENDTTCFTVSGNPFFDTTLIDQLYSGCRPPLRVEQNGNLQVWQAPRVGEFYVVGVDPGGQANIGKRSGKSMPRDYATASVVDSRGSHAATLHGHYDTRAFAEAVGKLGEYYNNAQLIIEAGPYGESTILVLSTYLHYRNLYVEKDPITGRPIRVGKLSTQGAFSGKKVLGDNMKELFETGTFHTDDRDLLNEMRNFHQQLTAQGRVTLNAIAGNDDRVMATMLALWAWSEGGFKRGSSRTKIHYPESSHGNL